MSVGDSVFFWLQKGQPVLLGAQSASEFCYFCKKRVYIMERQAAEGVFFHRHCLKCDYCSVGLRLNNYSCERPQGEEGEQRCSSCESNNDNNDSSSRSSSEEPLIRYHLNGRPLLFFLLLSLSLSLSLSLFFSFQNLNFSRNLSLCLHSHRQSVLQDHIQLVTATELSLFFSLCVFLFLFFSLFFFFQ